MRRVPPRRLRDGGAAGADERAAADLLQAHAVLEPDDLAVERVWRRVAGEQEPRQWARVRPRFGLAAGGALALVAVLAVVSLPRAPARGTGAALAVVEGGVFVTRPTERWQPVEAGQPVAESQRVRADAEGRAVLRIPGVAAVLIGPGTDVSLERLHAGTFLRLSKGTLVARVSKQSADAPFVIQTDAFTVKVVGTSLQVDQDPGGHTSVGVREGIVEVSGQDGHVWRVPAGQRWSSEAPDAVGAAAIGDRTRALLEAGLGGAPEAALAAELAAVAAETAPPPLPTQVAGAPAPQPSPVLVPPVVLARPRIARAEPAASRPQPQLAAPASPPTPAPAPAAALPVAQVPPVSPYAAGLALERQGDLSSAAAAFLEATAPHRPGADVALYALGRLYQRRLRDDGSALAAFQRYRSEYPAGPLTPEVDLAILELDVRTHGAEALEESARFLATHPGSERTDEVHVLRGNLLRSARRAREALAEYAAVTSGPLADEALYGTAYCLQRLGDRGSALAALRAYQRRFPAGAHRSEVATAIGAAVER